MKKPAKVITCVYIYKSQLDFAKKNKLKLSKLLRTALDGAINEIKGNSKKT
jgi:hypothetical protein